MSVTTRKTRIRVKAPAVERDDDPVASDDEEKTQPETQTKALSLHGPFATRRHILDLLTKTKDGKLIFQGRQEGNVLTTDVEGYRWPRKGDAKQFVFNATPEDLRRHTHRPKFVIGEVIYTIRPMSRSRKVFAARVEGMDSGGVILSVLGATGDSKFGRKRTRPDGTIIQPAVHCFKETRDLQSYLDAFRDDFSRAQTDFRQLLELKRSTP